MLQPAPLHFSLELSYPGSASQPPTLSDTSPLAFSLMPETTLLNASPDKQPGNPSQVTTTAVGQLQWGEDPGRPSALPSAPPNAHPLPFPFAPASQPPRLMDLAGRGGGAAVWGVRAAIGSPLSVTLTAINRTACPLAVSYSVGVACATEGLSSHPSISSRPNAWQQPARGPSPRPSSSPYLTGGASQQQGGPAGGTFQHGGAQSQHPAGGASQQQGGGQLQGGQPPTGIVVVGPSEHTLIALQPGQALSQQLVLFPMRGGLYQMVFTDVQAASLGEKGEPQALGSKKEGAGGEGGAWEGAGGEGGGGKGASERVQQVQGGEPGAGSGMPSQFGAAHAQDVVHAAARLRKVYASFSPVSIAVEQNEKTLT